MKLSIVIPVYNGQESIGALTDLLISEITPRFELEIVLVNDCSPDRSEAECIAIHARHPSVVKFYSLAKNVGEHNAVMAGLHQTTGEYIVIMDDDFQNPVSEVIKLVDYAVAQQADVVYTRYEEKQHSWFRNFGSRFNDKVANVMLGKPKDLYLSSFKIMHRFVVENVIAYTSPYPYIDGLILRVTSNIQTLTVDHHKRKAGRSNYTLRKLISLWMNMFTNFSVLPLRVSGFIGLFLAICGFVLGIFVVYEKLTNPSLPVGYTSLLVVVSIFSGVQLVALGMVGEYVGRIFIAQNKRPQFTIRKSFE